MASRIDIGPDEPRKLAAALMAYKQAVEAAGKRVQGALSAADWHDPQKDKFEAHYRDFQRSISRFLAGEVDAMVKDLNNLARKLDEIKAMKL